MGYVIVTDSVLDIEERFLHQNGICTVPLSFTIDGYDTVEDDFGKTVPFSDFYRQLRDGAAVTTAQAPISAFTSVFEGILKSKRDVGQPTLCQSALCRWKERGCAWHLCL